MLLMLLSFFTKAQTQLSCKDSLKLAIKHGKTLAKAVKDRDSLLSIRLNSISLLTEYNLYLQKEKDSLSLFVQANKDTINSQKNYISHLEKKNKKEKRRKNISYGISIIVISLLFLL